MWMCISSVKSGPSKPSFISSRLTQGVTRLRLFRKNSIYAVISPLSPSPSTAPTVDRLLKAQKEACHFCHFPQKKQSRGLLGKSLKDLDEEAAWYHKSVGLLLEARIPFLIGGAYALWKYT